MTRDTHRPCITVFDPLNWIDILQCRSVLSAAKIRFYVVSKFLILWMRNLLSHFEGGT